MGFSAMATAVYVTHLAQLTTRSRVVGLRLEGNLVMGKFHFLKTEYVVGYVEYIAVRTRHKLCCKLDMWCVWDYYEINELL